MISNFKLPDKETIIDAIAEAHKGEEQ